MTERKCWPDKFRGKDVVSQAAARESGNEAAGANTPILGFTALGLDDPNPVHSELVPIRDGDRHLNGVASGLDTCALTCAPFRCPSPTALSARTHCQTLSRWTGSFGMFPNLYQQPIANVDQLAAFVSAFKILSGNDFSNSGKEAVNFAHSRSSTSRGPSAIRLSCALTIPS
jgi:hypothetical protein